MTTDTPTTEQRHVEPVSAGSQPKNSLPKRRSFGRPFKPGQSGNPQGRREGTVSLRAAICRVLTAKLGSASQQAELEREVRSFQSHRDHLHYQAMEDAGAPRGSGAAEPLGK